MAPRNPQTMAKRAREQAVKERRDRKRTKKAAAAADRAAAHDALRGDSSGGDALLVPAAPELSPPSET